MEGLQFSREDVVRHLAELGYNNVEESKLDSFCADLRRLIRHEEKQKRVEEKLERLERNQKLMEESKENTSPPELPKKNRIRKEEKRRRKEAKLRSKLGESSNGSLPSSSRSIEEEARSGETSDGAVCSSQEASSLYIDVELSASRSTSARAALAASLLDQPQAGFIRARSGPGLGKRDPNTDPVQLHQYYQAQWAKASIPGERKHDRLRWAVRGWMMGEEPT